MALHAPDAIISKMRAAGHQGETDENMLNDYANWASEYEQVVHYQGHIQINDAMCKIYDGEARKKIQVMDVGAGTGVVGKKLRASGFDHIDALDPSKDMLEQARKMTVYENYFYDYLTRKPLPDIKQDSYDALVGSGVYGHCHIPTEALHEMIRIVKPGGHIVLATRHTIIHTYDQYRDLEPTMDMLESQGKWIKVDRSIQPSFYDDHEGIVWHYKVL